MVQTSPGLYTILSCFPLSVAGVLMMRCVGRKIQVSVISVPWECTRCSVSDTMACLVEILMTELRICGTQLSIFFLSFQGLLLKFELQHTFLIALAAYKENSPTYYTPVLTALDTADSCHSLLCIVYVFISSFSCFLTSLSSTSFHHESKHIPDISAVFFWISYNFLFS